MPQRTNGPRLAVKADRLREVARLAGAENDAQIADRLGMDASTVSRLLGRAKKPGEDAIACILTAFPDASFDDLFEVVPETEESAA